jgi:hypothetical protein
MMRMSPHCVVTLVLILSLVVNPSIAGGHQTLVRAPTPDRFGQEALAARLLFGTPLTGGSLAIRHWLSNSVGPLTGSWRREQWYKRNRAWRETLLSLAIGSGPFLLAAWIATTVIPQRFSIPPWVGTPYLSAALAGVVSAAYFYYRHPPALRNAAARFFAVWTLIAGGLLGYPIGLAWVAISAGQHVPPPLWYGIAAAFTVILALGHYAWNGLAAPDHPKVAELRGLWEIVTSPGENQEKVRAWVIENARLHDLNWLLALRIMAEDAIEQADLDPRILKACKILQTEVSSILSLDVKFSTDRLVTGDLPVKLSFEHPNLFRLIPEIPPKGMNLYAAFPPMVNVNPEKMPKFDPKLVLDKIEKREVIYVTFQDKIEKRTAVYIPYPEYLAKIAGDFKGNESKRVEPEKWLKKRLHRRGYAWMYSLGELLQDENLQKDMPAYRVETLKQLDRLVQVERMLYEKKFTGDKNPLRHLAPTPYKHPAVLMAELWHALGTSEASGIAAQLKTLDYEVGMGNADELRTFVRKIREENGTFKRYMSSEQGNYANNALQSAFDFLKGSALNYGALLIHIDRDDANEVEFILLNRGSGALALNLEAFTNRFKSISTMRVHKTTKMEKPDFYFWSSGPELKLQFPDEAVDHGMSLTIRSSLTPTPLHRAA